MTSVERQAHWESVYATKGEREVSWFEESPTISLNLIRSTGVSTSASIIDIGGGASRLVDALMDEGFETVTVLDLSETALATASARLSVRGAKVRWVVADVTTWDPSDCCTPTGDADHPHRICKRLRSGWPGFRREPAAPGGQYQRLQLRRRSDGR
jgi:hypothetical protein